MAELHPDTLSKLRVVDLKEKLSSRGLSTSGLKADLVKRLREALLSEPQWPEKKNEEIEEQMASESNAMDDKRKTWASDEGTDSAEAEQLGQTTEEQMRVSEKQQDRFSEGEQQNQSDESMSQDMEVMDVEEERRWSESDEQQRKWAEVQEREKAEEERNEKEQKMQAEEECKQKLEEQRRINEMERQRRSAEEEQMRIQEAEMQRIKAEQEHRRRAEQERLRAEEQRLRQMEEEKLRLAKEQQKMLVEEQKRKLAEAEKLRLAEEQQRLLAEEKKKLAEQQQRLLVEEGRKQLAEQQQRMLAEEQRRLLAEEQQRLLAEEERQKEKELFQLQQQALIEKDEEQRNQTVLSMPPPTPVAFPPGLHIPPPTTAPAVQSLPPVSQQIQGPPLGHVLTVSPQPPASVHVQIRPPPPPPSLSSIGALPPPPPALLVSSVQPRAPPPPGPMPPPPNVASSTSIPMVQISITSLQAGGQIPHFTQPPPPPVSGTMLTTSMPPPPPPSSQPASVTMTNSVATKSDSTVQMDITPSSTAQSSSVTVPGSDSTSNKEEAIKLPQAVEKVFALKTKRAQQLGVDPDSVITPTIEKDSQTSTKPASITLVAVDELEDDEDMEDDEASKKAKESKKRHRKKKKKQKRSKANKPTESAAEKKTSDSKEQSVDIDIEYVQEVLDPSDPMYGQFIKIFERFKLNEPDLGKADASSEPSKDDMQQNAANKVLDKKKPADLDDEDDDDRDDEKKDEEKPKLSKRKMKKLSRMTVAELKQKVCRPELVEMHDVTAKDPVLLLHLKASRNTVPVPRHWCFKRKYLQGKRGIEKPAFELPDFIKRTGIMEMRQALQEKEDQKTMKAKMRERVRPKLGKIDIDYQKLHDAFFKWQTKPKMTIHGDLYYEGKEFETRLKEKKPGDLSDDLRIALGMPTGPNANKCPPPWLIAMQRYGPPPSYPNLKIPGLNAPIPDGCSFGYHAGGWGKPPVDEMGRPLYGDVFGTQAADNMPQIPEEEIDHTLWGELESESSEEEEDEDEEDEDEDEQKGEDETGLVTPAEGLITPSGFSSIPAGMETPDMIELRKRKTEAEMEGGETPALYTILPEKKSDRVGAAMMGSTHIYDLSAAIPASKVKASGTTSVPPQGIEVALDPSELEMDTAAMAARYEQTMREQQSQLEKEDLSDMVAEHAARQKTKRKKQQQDSGKAPKKYKEFKF